jgi:phosphoglycerate dehydrogenase-like enzyme
LEILLIERLVPEAQAWLEARHHLVCKPELADDATALRKQLYNVHSAVLPRKVAITRELLDFAPVLRVVARMDDGTEDTDLEACRDRKVRVIVPTNAHVRSNAEFLLASLMSLYRRGITGGRPEIGSPGRELHSSVVGLFGLAPSAHAFALMLDALGAKLIGYDPAVHSTAPIWNRLRVHPVSLQELMSQSDAIAVQVLYASRYEAFINDKVLAPCKPGQVWVGTTRGSLFEPQAFARALSDGRIDAAVLDNVDAAFAARGSPLHGLSNLFLTPRLGSNTRESRVRASWYVAQRLDEILSRPRSGTTEFDQLMSGPMGLEGDSGFGRR